MLFALLALAALGSAVGAAVTPPVKTAATPHAAGAHRPRGPKRPPPAMPYPAQFPEGQGHLIAERACAMCHSPMLVTQQAKDSTGWEKTLATMEKWGAPVSGADHDTLRDYLLSNFGPKRR
jgi:cytochrome c5